MQSTTDHKMARYHRADCMANPRTKPSLACGTAMYTGGVMERTQEGFDLLVWHHLRQIERVAKAVAMVCLCGTISARSREWPRLWPWYVCVAQSPQIERVAKTVAMVCLLSLIHI